MMLTYTKGKEFNYLNFKKENVDFMDIIQSLPRINRFVGHTSKAYSVGEHTLNCLRMAQALGYNVREQLLVFMHDFTEAYVTDCPTPLKDLLPKFGEIEASVEKAIYEYFGVGMPTEEEYKKIKHVDYTMMLVEMKYLTQHNYEDMINENTVTKFLDGDGFTIATEPLSEDFIRTLLSVNFVSLMSEYMQNYNILEGAIYGND